MSSRDAILAGVRAAQPAEVALPSLPETLSGRDLVSAFSEALQSAAAEILLLSREDLWAHLLGRDGDPRIGMASGTPPSVVPIAPESVSRVDAGTSLDDLAELDLLVCGGVFGVAENGAIWLPESRCGHRAAPFLARRLVVVLDAAAIVPTMHEAYARIDLSGEGFGMFVAGPSKTADIEQALVIGAHGPLGMVVAMVE